MSDNTNLTQEALQKAWDKVGSAMKGRKSAATVWLKYNQSSILAPNPGEWCLWSMESNGERYYFCGYLFMSGSELRLERQGVGLPLPFRPCNPDSTLYYARINEMVFPLNE